MGEAQIDLRRTSGFATTALVLCLLGLLTCGFTAVLAIPFGHLALSDIKRHGLRGDGMAIVALVVGYVILAVGLITLVAAWGIGASTGSA
jgi:ABC-type spermidine/putrescine transport system permease subunit II